MGTRPPLPTRRTLVSCPAPRALARPGASRGAPHRRQAPGSVRGRDSWSLLVEGNMSRGGESSHLPTPLDITFLSPIFQILLGFCYHTMVYFDIIESALTPAFTWSKVPRPRRPTIPLTGDKAPPAWTGRNLINHVPPKGPISYLFIYLFNQTLPGTHYCTSKIFSHFTL